MPQIPLDDEQIMHLILDMFLQKATEQLDIRSLFIQIRTPRFLLLENIYMHLKDKTMDDRQCLKAIGDEIDALDELEYTGSKKAFAAQAYPTDYGFMVGVLSEALDPFVEDDFLFKIKLLVDYAIARVKDILELYWFIEEKKIGKIALMFEDDLRSPGIERYAGTNSDCGYFMIK